MLRTIVLAAVTLLLALGLTPGCAPGGATGGGDGGGGGEGATYHWTLAVDQNLEHPQVQALMEFKDMVFERSDGRIDIDVQHSGVLGDWSELFEELIRGNLEMYADPLASIYDPRLDVIYIPYIVTDWEEAEALYARGGYVFETARNISREVGVEMLSNFPFGSIGMGTSKAAPSPGDPSVMKDLKIRVWPAQPPQLLIEALGYIVTPMPWSDVFSSMQTGVIDGYFGADIVTSYNLVRDVTDYWYPYRGFFETNQWCINEELWASLSAEDQGILFDAAQELSSRRFTEGAQAEIDAAQMYRDYGAEVIEFTPDEYEAFRAVAIEKVWPEMNSILGKSIMDGAKEAIGAM